MKLFNRIYTASVLCAATAITLAAQTVTTLFSFGLTNGAYPQEALVQGTDGYLYGTTPLGGINCAPTGGCGTVFKITPNGTLTTLYSFCAFSGCTDGAVPYAPLVQTANGEFYGTTSGGTIFKMTPSGLLTTIYNFCSQVGCPDGAQPMAGLVEGTGGVLYGTTYAGGANNGGTIFKITPDGALATLYSFCSQRGCADGEGPTAGLVQAANGEFYGTTIQGGSSAYCASVISASGCGTVFRITPSGTFTTLYNFCAQSGCTDGANPQGGLVQATNGRFYGITYQGGSGGTGCGPYGCGTVFTITSSGALTTLHSFTGGDGSGPYAGLVQATDGNLYGTTGFGGLDNNNNGTVFKITPTGSLTTIFNFVGSPGAGTPEAALVQDTNGRLYGATYFGGTDLACAPFGCGTIFSLAVGLSPFVKLQPASGQVGDVVEILGSNLIGVTAVSFNGTPAIFKVASNTLITTHAPSGATTGKVQVTTPNGTLLSDVSFRVRP